MKNLTNYIGKYFSFLLLAVALVACGGDDEIPTPTSEFTFTEDASTPGKINFTNTSKNAVAYFWDFGDNTTSSLASPTHIYSSNGNFQVTLTTFATTGNSGKLPGKAGGSGKKSSKQITVTNAQSTFTANMTGSGNFTFTAAQTQAMRNSSEITVAGVSNNGTIFQLSIPANATAGSTYYANSQQPPSSVTKVSYQTSVDTYYAHNISNTCTGATGTITINSVSPTLVTGTFSGKVFRNNCAGSYTINSGNFAVKF